MLTTIKGTKGASMEPKSASQEGLGIKFFVVQNLFFQQNNFNQISYK